MAGGIELSEESVRETRRWLYTACDDAGAVGEVVLGGAGTSQTLSDAVAERLAVTASTLGEHYGRVADEAGRWQTGMWLLDLGVARDLSIQEPS